MTIPRLTIKSRLMVLMVMLCIIICVTLGLIADRRTQTALRDRVVGQLESVRSSRATEIESYLGTMRDHVGTLSVDPTVSEAAMQFANIIRTDADRMVLDEAEQKQLETFYEQSFFPTIRARGDGDPVLENYLPATRWGRYLQYHYLSSVQWVADDGDDALAIAAEPADTASVNRSDGDASNGQNRSLNRSVEASGSGDTAATDQTTGGVTEKDRRTDDADDAPTNPTTNSASTQATDTTVRRGTAPLPTTDISPDADDRSRYHDAENQFNRYFRRIADAFDYYDVFLVDVETLDVLYTVRKEIDYATNLRSGPYSDSSLAAACRRAAESPNKDFVAVEDFQFYRASFGVPAAFMAAPIYDGTRKIGIVAVQLPVDEINRLMTAGGQWRSAGMGTTGQSFLVGRDHTMRSDERELLEDFDVYIEQLRSSSVSRKTIQRIEQLKTSILLRPVDNPAARAARGGETGVMSVDHVQGYTALTSYQPLDIDGLDWVLMSEINVNEAFSPLRELRSRVILWSASLILLTTLLSMLLANNVVRPIEKFVDDSRLVVDGEKEWFEVRAGDEFGVLAYELNKLLGGLREQTEAVDRRSQSYRGMLEHVMPPRIVESLIRDDAKVIDTHPNVSVLTAVIEGLDSDAGGNDDADMVLSHVTLIDRLTRALDGATEGHRIEKVKADGSMYVVTCGTGVPRLDHARRLVDFAIDMQSKVRAFNQQNDSHVRVRIGIASGPVVSGLVGSVNMIFDVWGSPVERSGKLARATPPGTIAMGPAAMRSLGETIEIETHINEDDEELFLVKTDLPTRGSGPNVAPIGGDSPIGTGATSSAASSPQSPLSKPPLSQSPLSQSPSTQTPPPQTPPPRTPTGV